MSSFRSSLAYDINALLDYREALGYSRKSQATSFKNLDAFMANTYPEISTLTKEAVLEWLEEYPGEISKKSSAVRLLGKFMQATGKDSYVLYDSYAKSSAIKQPAYIFTDDELSALFLAVDKTKPSKKEPFLNEILPILYRLIYTCGLRPNEGRELMCKNVNLKTGEILITNTKHKKERLVVMSKDVLAMCRSYNKIRKIFARGNEYFFPSFDSKGCFTNYQIGWYLRDAWHRANPAIAKENLPNIRVYDLRHRFASATLIRWLDSGQPLRSKLAYLRAYMGHNKLSDTAYYIHLLPENLAKSAGIDWNGLDEMIPEVVSWER